VAEAVHAGAPEDVGAGFPRRHHQRLTPAGREANIRRALEVHARNHRVGPRIEVGILLHVAVVLQRLDGEHDLLARAEARIHLLYERLDHQLLHLGAPGRQALDGSSPLLRQSFCMYNRTISTILRSSISTGGRAPTRRRRARGWRCRRCRDAGSGCGSGCSTAGCLSSSGAPSPPWTASCSPSASPPCTCGRSCPAVTRARKTPGQAPGFLIVISSHHDLTLIPSKCRVRGERPRSAATGRRAEGVRAYRRKDAISGVGSGAERKTEIHQATAPACKAGGLLLVMYGSISNSSS
jgi:hypothetical protein